MKNNFIIRYFKALSMIVPAFALCIACEQSIEPENVKQAVSITSSDVLFGPRGGVGTIGFVSDADVTAYSEQPWCAVSVDGDLVTVRVGEYADLENRYSSIILKAGEDSVKVVAQQNGVIMTADAEKEYILDNSKTDFSFKVKSNTDIKVKSSSSWLRCSLSEDEVLVNLKDNDSGHLRTGWIEYSCGNLADTVWVSQGEASDLHGNYRLLGYDSSNALVYLPAVISAGDSDNEIKVTCTANGSLWTFKGVFDQDTHKVRFNNANNVGNLTLSGYTFNIFLCLLSKSTNNFNWNPQLYCTSQVSYDDKSQCTTIEIEPMSYTSDNGTEMKMDSWVFAAFQNVDAETGLPKGTASAYPAILYYPFFQSL